MRKYVHLPRRHSKSQSPSNPKPRRLEGVQRHYIVYSDIIIIIIIIIIIVVVAVVVAVRHAWGEVLIASCADTDTSGTNTATKDPVRTLHRCRAHAS